ncbi:HAMP domain-containing sensor histidine kinase, partial [Glycomyces tenuis]
MLRRRLTVTVLVLLLTALVVTVGATIGAVQDWRQDLVRDGLDVATAERQLLQRVVAVSGSTALATLLLTGGLAWMTIGRQLRGITGLVTVARRFGRGELGTRMPVRPKTEAGTLATAFNTMADELEGELERRRRAEEDLRRFLADASHELRTPVATVRGYAELFRRGAADDPQTLATTMARIESESARIGALVEGMLALAGSAQVAVRQTGAVSLRDLASEAVDAARVRDLERRWLVEDGPDVTVTGDSSSLRRLLDNLLANGTAHTPRGTTVTVRVGSEPGAALVEVVDDGPGLPPSMSGDPFDRFTRAAAASGPDTRSGTGLGLAIVRAIAEAHGGTARISTGEAARGLTVRVRLP